MGSEPEDPLGWNELIPFLFFLGGKTKRQQELPGLDSSKFLPELALIN